MIHEPPCEPAVPHPGGAALGNGEGFGPVLVDHGLEPLGDVVHRLVPGDTLPMSVAPGAYPLQWINDTVRVRELLRRVCALHAQHAFEQWMVPRGYLDDTAFLDLGGDWAKAVATGTHD